MANVLDCDILVSSTNQLKESRKAHTSSTILKIIFSIFNICRFPKNQEKTTPF